MFAIYTNELIESRKRRMPWRTVLEVARHCGAIVFSGDGEAAGVVIDGVRVEYVSRPLGRAAARILADRMLGLGVNRLYFPVVPGRSYGELQEACDAAGIEIAWYITSSWNSVGRALRAWRWMGFKAVRPYLIQALTPKRNWIKRLSRKCERSIITMSHFTARRLVECGYPATLVHPILPGLDSVRRHCSCQTSGDKYFLFFGPPQKIRGIYLILKAVRSLAKRRNDFRLITLVRGDENAKCELEELKCHIDHLNTLTSRRVALVEAHYEHLGTDEINAYIDNATAILKPFVLVPSEIPLAPMEAMQRGRLVIGFEGDGTGELIGEHGITVRHCDVNALTDAMECALDGKYQPQKLAYDTWPEVAEKWRGVWSN